MDSGISYLCIFVLLFCPLQSIMNDVRSSYVLSIPS